MFGETGSCRQRRDETSAVPAVRARIGRNAPFSGSQTGLEPKRRIQDSLGCPGSGISGPPCGSSHGSPAFPHPAVDRCAHHSGRPRAGNPPGTTGSVCTWAAQSLCNAPRGNGDRPLWPGRAGPASCTEKLGGHPAIECRGRLDPDGRRRRRLLQDCGGTTRGVFQWRARRGPHRHVPPDRIDAARAMAGRLGRLPRAARGHPAVDQADWHDATQPRPGRLADRGGGAEGTGKYAKTHDGHHGRCVVSQRRLALPLRHAAPHAGPAGGRPATAGRRPHPEPRLDSTRSRPAPRAAHAVEGARQTRRGRRAAGGALLPTA